MAFGLYFSNKHQTNLVLNELPAVLTSTLVVKSLVHQILKQLSHLFNSQPAVCLLRNDPEVRTIHLGFEDPPVITSNSLKQLLKKITSKPIGCPSLTDPESRAACKTLKAALIVSLKTSDQSFGLLCLGNRRSGRRYSPSDISLLTAITPAISMAIGNALAYEKIHLQNLALKKNFTATSEKLQTANKSLRHLDKIKDEFVYLASHELKSPVAAMKGYLSMIDEGSFGKVPENFIEPIKQLNVSNQQLVNLVNNLLDIARSEAHVIKIKSNSINLYNIIEEVTNSVKPLADQKNITIDFSAVKRNLSVKADAERLKEILNNLLSNAIKYSAKGQITIFNALERNQVITHVKDQGVGIGVKDQAKIFTRFFRVAEEVSKGIPGSGLGLFIVRQLVQKMGGKIWFTSTLGKGSTFSFTLPKVPLKS